MLDVRTVRAGRSDLLSDLMGLIFTAWRFGTVRNAVGALLASWCILKAFNEMSLAVQRNKPLKEFLNSNVPLTRSSYSILAPFFGRVLSLTNAEILRKEADFIQALQHGPPAEPAPRLVCNFLQLQCGPLRSVSDVPLKGLNSLCSALVTALKGVSSWEEGEYCGCHGASIAGCGEFRFI